MKRAGVDLTAGKQRFAVRIARIRLRAPKHDSVETMPVIDHVAGILKKAGIEQPNQHPKPKMITLMRRRRQEEQVAAMLAQRLSKLEVLRLANFLPRLGSCEVMGFVEDDQVPSRCIEQPL